MLSSYSAKGNPHDGISARGKDVELTILNEITLRISNLMLKSKPYTLTFTNPILLHDLDALWPT